MYKEKIGGWWAIFDWTFVWGVTSSVVHKTRILSHFIKNISISCDGKRFKCRRL